MSFLDAIKQRIRDLLTEGDPDLHEEIADHIARETARQVAAGLPYDKARARALALFGDRRAIADAATDVRGKRPIEGWLQDCRWALRSLRKNVGFTALAVVTLTLGIGATTVGFTVLDTILLRPLPYRSPEQLVFISEKDDKQALRPASYPNFASWRDEARSFSGVAAATFPFSATVVPADGAEPVRAAALDVSRRFFAILGVSLAAGREFSDEENRVGGARAVMVSYEFWKTQMNGRIPLGTVDIDGEAVPVTGVTPPGFVFGSTAAMFYPGDRTPGTMRSAHGYRVIGRLRPGVSLDAARSDMTSLSKRLKATYGNETQASDADLVSFRDYVVGDRVLTLRIIFAASVLVLLIACTNLVSAQLARGRVREREIVVRSALGASRGRIVRQLLCESGIIAVAGAACGLALAFAAVNAIRVVGQNQLPRLQELSIDGSVVAFVACIVVLTTIVVGVYPALRLSRRDATLALRSTRGGFAVRASVWRALVGAEVAFAVVLLIASALLIRTLGNIVNADTGFDNKGVVTASIVPRDVDLARIDEIERSLASLPGVDGAAFTNLLPFAWGNSSGPVRRRSDPLDRDWPAMAGFRIVTPNYFSVLRQPIVAGRAFTPNDRDGAALVAIITPGIAKKLWPGENPVGKTIATNYLFKDWLTVVGVVAEASSWSMARGEQNEIFVPFAQHPRNTEGQLVAVVRARTSTATVTDEVRRQLRQLLPQSPADLSTLEARIERSAADRRFAMLSLTAFGGIALVLAMLGIYGVIWYVVSTRRHEIGVRMALGATTGMVQRGVLVGAASMAAWGAGFGVVLAYVATRYLESTLYGVSRADPMTFGIGAGAAMIGAIAGAWIPARRSSRVDPVTALRAE